MILQPDRWVDHWNCWQETLVAETGAYVPGGSSLWRPITLSKSHWSYTSIILRYESIWYHMHINILNLEFSPNSKCFCCFCTSNVSSIPSSPWNLLCSVTIWTYSPCPAIPLCPESWWYTSSIHAIVHNSYIWDFENLKVIVNPWCEIQFSVQLHTLQHFNKSEVFNLYTWWFKIRTPGWSKTPMSRKVSCWPKPISGRTRLDRCCTVSRCLEKFMTRCGTAVGLACLL